MLRSIAKWHEGSIAEKEDSSPDRELTELKKIERQSKVRRDYGNPVAICSQ